MLERSSTAALYRHLPAGRRRERIHIASWVYRRLFVHERKRRRYMLCASVVFQRTCFMSVCFLDSHCKFTLYAPSGHLY
jgi:hypothetical protein